MMGMENAGKQNKGLGFWPILAMGLRELAILVLSDGEREHPSWKRSFSFLAVRT
jgi:hypothetical protein